MHILSIICVCESLSAACRVAPATTILFILVAEVVFAPHHSSWGLPLPPGPESIPPPLPIMLGRVTAPSLAHPPFRITFTQPTVPSPVLAVHNITHPASRAPPSPLPHPTHTCLRHHRAGTRYSALSHHCGCHITRCCLSSTTYLLSRYFEMHEFFYAPNVKVCNLLYGIFAACTFFIHA